MTGYRNEILGRIRQGVSKAEDAVKLYNIIGGIITRAVKGRWKEYYNSGSRSASYLSMEFLTGRSIQSNLLNLGILGETGDILKEKGLNINILEDIEDAALGNGGLGRLAACFLESAATCRIPLNGFGIRYKYGFFKQVFIDGCQAELPDDWQSFGDPFSIRHDEDTETIKFSDMEVPAVPYDMPVIGYKGRIGNLRLWQAEGCCGEISERLYPDDSTEEGKLLRLRQEYFFSSASVKSLVKAHIKKHGDINSFEKYNILQLNDTHPVFAVPELIRIFIREFHMEFSDALLKAKKCFAYTNHTVMGEALEQWDTETVKKLLPEIYEIAVNIDKAAAEEFAGRKAAKKDIANMNIITGRRLHMARLAVYCSQKVNGVAELHTQILKDSLFKEFYALYPERFVNSTNGVTQRRWLKLCNGSLSDLIASKTGNGFIKDLTALKKLESYCGDEDFLNALNEVKFKNKKRLSDYILKHEGVFIDPHFIFDIQVKRLHEYKRQLMNALSIIHIYLELKEGKLKGFTPTAFIFGAKAFPTYSHAKDVIKLINDVAKKVNNDSEVNKLLKVVFVKNYNVSYAEMLMPAAEVSEQISLAGTEASGTGNMKMMLNGAVTLGTMDGANIEIVNAAGKENNYIFGAEVEEINSQNGVYNPKNIIKNYPFVKRIINTLSDGTFAPKDENYIKRICNYLQNNDRFMALYDLPSYIESKLKLNEEYRDRKAFAKKCLKNIANAGRFSSDRTVREYDKKIWHTKLC